MTAGTFLAIFGVPALLACVGLSWLVVYVGDRWDSALLYFGVLVGGWAGLTVVMSLLSYNLLAPGE